MPLTVLSTCEVTMGYRPPSMNILIPARVASAFDAVNTSSPPPQITPGLTTQVANPAELAARTARSAMVLERKYGEYASSCRGQDSSAFSTGLAPTRQPAAPTYTKRRTPAALAAMSMLRVPATLSRSNSAWRHALGTAPPHARRARTLPSLSSAQPSRRGRL